MRVVAGLLRGRKFEAPEGFDTRPTTDRAREAIFNALGSLDVVRNARVADLYAGSGGLGIEALSRGAGHVTFVENQRNALTSLRTNLSRLDLTSKSTVLATDAMSAAGRLDVDVALADPPYDFDEWPALLSKISAPLVVAESARAVDAPPGWEAIRTKRYGRTWVTFLARAGAPGDAPPTSSVSDPNGSGG